MKKLYFVRHGESLANQKGLFAGTWDVPLTERGRNQARLAARQATQLELDCIVSSSLLRALETAEIIADNINYPEHKIIKSDLLVERNYGDLQQRPWSVADGIDFEQVKGIETSAQLLARGKKAARFVKDLPYDNILVVGHGTFGRVLRDRILNQPAPSKFLSRTSCLTRRSLLGF